MIRWEHTACVYNWASQGLVCERGGDISGGNGLKRIVFWGDNKRETSMLTSIENMFLRGCSYCQQSFGDIKDHSWASTNSKLEKKKIVRCMLFAHFTSANSYIRLQQFSQSFRSLVTAIEFGWYSCQLSRGKLDQYKISF